VSRAIDDFDLAAVKRIVARERVCQPGLVGNIQAAHFREHRVEQRDQQRISLERAPGGTIEARRRLADGAVIGVVERQVEAEADGEKELFAVRP
jgi:hypothetical protein